MNSKQRTWFNRFLALLLEGEDSGEGDSILPLTLPAPATGEGTMSVIEKFPKE